MFNSLEKSRYELIESPFVSFNSNGDGISQIFDDRWDFVARQESVRFIIFTKIPLEHRSNIQICVYEIMKWYMEQSNNNHVSVSKILRIKNTLWKISKLWGYSKFSILENNIEWLKFKEVLRENSSLVTIKNISTVLNDLYKANLLNRIFKNEELFSLASSKKSKQHIALPSTIHANLIQQVVNIVNTYHPYRYEISSVTKKSIKYYDTELPKELQKRKIIKLNENGTKNLNLRVVNYANQLGRLIPNFKFKIKGGWINNLVKKCLMLVVMFTGMRSSEARNTNPSSYKILSGISVLQSNTYKGNQGVAKKETWVTHPIVLMALELAYEITNYTREHNKKILAEKLANKKINIDIYRRGLEELSSSFISANLDSKRYNHLQTNYLLTTTKDFFNLDSFEVKATSEEVKEFNLLNPDWHGRLKINESLPKLSLHDLRRSFAVFMIRNRLGNLQTIKYQFKHKNISMSDWYANNAELARFEDLLMDTDLIKEVEKAMQGLAVEAFEDIYNNSKYLSGGGSNRIIEEREKALGRGETIVLSRHELESLVQSGAKSIVLLPTGGYCTNSSCERLCSLESVSRESKPCKHLIITDKGAKQMAAQRNRLIESFESMNELGDYAYSRILAGFSMRIHQIEQTLKKHNIYFSPFTQSIRGQA